jgi:multidrug efflux system outer membrane protein
VQERSAPAGAAGRALGPAAAPARRRGGRARDGRRQRADRRGRAAYYPSITLGAAGGYDSRAFATLFDAPSLLWSLGVSAAAAVRCRPHPRQRGGAKAGYQATVGNYRRVVLTAMQEVQDGITGSAALDRALAQARLAEQSALRVLQLATDRYEGGVADLLDVITAQQAVLNMPAAGGAVAGAAACWWRCFW